MTVDSPDGALVTQRQLEELEAGLGSRIAAYRSGYLPEERGLYPKQPLIDQLVYLAQLRGVTASAARRPSRVR